MDSLQSNSLYKALHEISSDFSSMASSYFCASFNSADIVADELHRLDGLCIFLIREGELEIEINSVRSVFATNSFAAFGFGTAVKFVTSPQSSNKVDLLFFHTSFLQGVNINFAAISTPIIVDRSSSDVVLSDAELDVMLRYVDLLKLNCGTRLNRQVETNIASSLMAAMIYQMVGVHYKRLGSHNVTKGQRACRTAYVHDFIKLVHVYYAKERSVAFYADKLFISPKYLSLLVKDATGKSAARWIDEFVLMEAKNMLRFSGKNVQQVAYSLNFSNQSSFGKYFKHLTGMSPTEYQKS